LSEIEYTAEALLQGLEPQGKDGAVYDEWWDEMARHRSSNDLNRIGIMFAHPPRETVLGAGAFGSVWLARNRNHPLDQFAVKNMQCSAESNKEGVARNEFRIAQTIRDRPHPFIVRLFLVHQYSLSTNELYMLVMEYCPGGNLQKRMDQGIDIIDDSYRVPLNALTWIGQVFLALEHLHNVVDTMMRDLKPENVVLSINGCAKLTDFGYSRLFAHSHGNWTFDVPPGTPGYIAPEILYNEANDTSCDIYSLGVICWAMLSGGVTEHSQVVPPVTGVGQNFSSYRDDWKALHSCYQNPKRARREVNEDALKVIQAMTDRIPGKRPRACELREYQFFKSLGLPDLPDGSELAPDLSSWRFDPNAGRSESKIQSPTGFDLSNPRSGIQKTESENCFLLF
jgi:serine/threonine protein kinase